jgi:transglutaminase-like putative cysteine protease
MGRWRVLPCVFFLGILLLITGGPLALAGDDWLPISPGELAMKSHPASPEAHAVILYREEQTDDTTSSTTYYFRLKIFTEEGKERANIEIPYLKELMTIRDIKARVIRPDGSVANFEGKPFDKTLVKGRGIKFLAKTFTLPEVQVGSIIEYKYKQEWDRFLLFDTHWIIPQDLFTVRARFSLKPFRGLFPLRWINLRIPDGKVAREDKGVIHLELENIPAFQKEEYMPPENELKSRVDFFYSSSSEMDPTKFWKEEGKRLYEEVDKFVGHRKGIERAAAEIVAPDDPPEIKLRKLYARAQQIRNLSIERRRTEKEEQREKLKDLENVEEVLKRGYGSGRQITWLFLALARGAGFQAWPVMVSRRNEYFFNPNALDRRQLNDNIVLVRLDSRDLFLDPGTAFCPFGMLPWGETGVQGLRLEKDGGAFVTTTLPPSSASRIERRASLELGESSALEGKLSVTLTGLEALRRRLEDRDEDEAGHRKSLEDEIKEWLPVGSTVELENSPDWKGPEEPLRAEFKIRMPNWANSAGRRLLFPVTLFAGSRQHRFTHATRVYPVYFDFPFQTVDEMTLKLPLIFQVSSLPEARNRQTSFGQYEMSCQAQGGTLRVVRRLSSEGLLIPLEYYSGLRGFFEMVRTGDDEQVVLQAVQVGQRN